MGKNRNRKIGIGIKDMKEENKRKQKRKNGRWEISLEKMGKKIGKLLKGEIWKKVAKGGIRGIRRENEEKRREEKGELGAKQRE